MTHTEHAYGLPLHILSALCALEHQRSPERRLNEKLEAWEIALKASQTQWEAYSERQARRWNMLWRHWNEQAESSLERWESKGMINAEQAQRLLALQPLLKGCASGPARQPQALLSCLERPLNSLEHKIQVQAIQIESITYGVAASDFHFLNGAPSTAQKATAQLALQSLEAALQALMEDFEPQAFRVNARYDEHFPINDNSIRLALILAVLNRMSGLNRPGMAAFGAVQSESLSIKAVPAIESAYTRIDACFDAGVKHLLLPADQILRHHPGSGVELTAVTDFQFKYALQDDPQDLMHIYRVDTLQTACEVLFGAQRQEALAQLRRPQGESSDFAPVQISHDSRLKLVVLSQSQVQAPSSPPAEEQTQLWPQLYNALRPQCPDTLRLRLEPTGLLSWTWDDPGLSQKSLQLLHERAQKQFPEWALQSQLGVVMRSPAELANWKESAQQALAPELVEILQGLPTETANPDRPEHKASAPAPIVIEPALDRLLTRALHPTSDIGSELPNPTLAWHSMLYIEQSQIETQPPKVQSQWKKHLLQYLQELSDCAALVQQGLMLRLKRGYLLLIPHFDLRLLRLLGHLFEDLSALQAKSSQPEKWKLKAVLQLELLPLDTEQGQAQVTESCLDRVEGMAYLGADGHILLSQSSAEIWSTHPEFPRDALQPCGHYDLSANLSEEICLFVHGKLGNPEPPLRLPVALRPEPETSAAAVGPSDAELLGEAHFRKIAARHGPVADSEINIDTMSPQVRDLILRALEHPGQFFFTRPVRYVYNQLGMIFRLILPGHYLMGSAPQEPGRSEDETQHMVRLDEAFYVMTTPVTQFQWEQVMGENPAYFKEPEAPVENVSWKDVQDFIQALQGRSQGQYRLPTEAEWEYCCRAGSSGAHGLPEADDRLEDFAWFHDNSDRGYPLKRTHPVATRQPNAWGLYDFHGNVWEWVKDWYGPYPEHLLNNPQGPFHGEERVIRGGRWNSSASGCRCALRSALPPETREAGNLGFRLIYVPTRS